MKRILIVPVLALALVACGEEVVDPTWRVQDAPSPSPYVDPYQGTTNWAPEKPSPSPRATKRATRSHRSGGMAGKVADCESGERLASGRAVPGTRRYHLIHYPSGRSSASGAYGFLDGTWRSVTGRSDRAYQATPADQDAAFYKLWDGGRGSFHWNASRSCWG